jgi:hypothetical protein
MPSRHGFGEEKASHLARGSGRHGGGEKEPDMRSVAGPRALHRERNTLASTCFDKGRYVVLPLLLVEIHCEEPAGLVREHRVDPDHVASLEVIANAPLRHPDECLIRAFAAFDAALIAYPLNPFIAARW